MDPFDSGDAKINSFTTIYDKIRDFVHTGEFQPGQPLRLESLSEMVNASATPIREALFRLSAEGIIERSNRGFKAPTIRTRMMSDRLSHLLIIIQRCIDAQLDQEESQHTPKVELVIGTIDPDVASANFEYQLECLVYRVCGDYWSGIVRLLCAQTRSIRRIDFEFPYVQNDCAAALVSAEPSVDLNPQLFYDATAGLKDRAEILVREYITRTIDCAQSAEAAPSRLAYTR